MFDFDDKHRSDLRYELIDYCLSHGLVVRPQPSLSENPRGCLVTHAPVALHPTPFPRSAFNAAKAIQVKYNELYADITESFLEAIMRDLIKVDDFMKRLWELYLEVKSDITQPISLGLFRSDYLLHTDNTIKQVEFNTISASFASLAVKTSELHRTLYANHDIDVPINEAIQGLAAGLVAAHKAYGKVNAHVVFIVQDGERNAFDQRWIEYELLQHKIKSHRVPFNQVQQLVKLDGDLLIHGEHEVSVVYYRAGYGPEDYTETEWASRRLIERSKAIKCPTILTQLAGSKKVQQVLAEESSGVSDDIRATFVGIHTLDASPAGEAAIKIALHSPSNYVLKPQREGGGHNIYRDAIPAFLKSIPESQWAGYILMELIKPPSNENTIVRGGELFPAEMVSELGIYGVILWDANTGKIMMNQEAGYLLRTKSTATDEGGVAAGFACIDSPYLV